MTTKLITAQPLWDELLKTIDHTPFTQSWDWGVFQTAQGHTVWRLAVQEGEKTMLLMQFSKVALKFGFFYANSACGPVVVDAHKLEESTATLIKFLKQLSKTEKFLFWRLEPSQAIPGQWKKVLDRQPARTRLIDLNLTETALLTQMHPKTRYNIKLAERKGVSVRFGRSAPEMDAFIRCIKETYDRHAIKSFPESYYRTQLETVTWEYVAVAEWQGQVVAANLLTTFGDTTTYLHGGSLSRHKELMAPHLLQWECLREARRRNSQWYDFYGIAPENTPDHPWAGITRFKAGFGGVTADRPGTFELPFSNGLYTLFNMAKRLRV